jgi:hypothetical protein
VRLAPCEFAASGDAIAAQLAASLVAAVTPQAPGLLPVFRRRESGALASQGLFTGDTDLALLVLDGPENEAI